MNITKEELYDVLFDIQKKKDNKNKFIIEVVGDFLNFSTPYSDSVYHYDNIDWLCDDLKYCLECEVKKK